MKLTHEGKETAYMRVTRDGVCVGISPENTILVFHSDIKTFALDTEIKTKADVDMLIDCLQFLKIHLKE